MNLTGVRIGFALTGSFCTFSAVLPEIRYLAVAGADIIPIMSRTAYTTDTRFGKAQDFINDLFNSLRERMLDVSAGVVVFVGGGAILLRRQIEESGKIGKVIFVEDINANAKGYEFLYQSESMRR